MNDRHTKAAMNLLIKLRQDFVSVLFPCQTIHDLQFGKLNIYGIVVFTEEHLNIVLEDCWSPLYDEQNVSQCNILHFRPRRQQSH